MDKKKRYFTLSVHQFVDFLFRVGDIDDRIYNQTTMQMGAKMHGSYQAKQGNQYQSEYPLSGKIEIEEGTIFLQGRADGLIVGGSYPVIDEIKTSIMPTKTFYEQQKQWHLSQALVYCYLYLLDHNETRMGVDLTYMSQIDSEDKMVKHFDYSASTIKEEVEAYARMYFEFFLEQEAHLDERDASSKKLAFPYQRFRAGQKELSKYVYGAISNGGILFAEAPTGIGKTLSALFPSVKSFAQKRVDRIFYLTAKQTGSLAAYQAMTQLYEAGLRCRDSVLVGKEKICLAPGCRCNPDSCPYAKGYYTKIKEIIKEVCKKTNRFDESTVLEMANKYQACPFEMQLDLSLFADVIICDYNYLLDPMVYLERYFDEGIDTSTDVFLLDEAHNLVDRSKDMYSVGLEFEEVEEAKKSLHGNGWRKLRKALKGFSDFLSTIPMDNQPTEIPCPKDELIGYIDAIRKAKTSEEKTTDVLPPEFTNLSKDLAKFRMILEEYYGDKYRCYTQKSRGVSKLKLHCVDPSSFIAKQIGRGRCGVFFSATLSPMEYYQQSILGKKDFPSLILPSPFSKDQMGLFVVPNVSIKYKDRAKSYDIVASILSRFISKQVGNYFLFFPSYEYLENILPYLSGIDAKILIQEKSLTPKRRKEMLEEFVPNPEKTTVGCYILGGSFGEGVDLVSDRLIGVGIVGVGMPQINYESDLVRDYYEEKEQKGFAYAYLYPGLNKVAQALGRLIRSESDRGAALLIDSRYRFGEYRAMLDRLHGEYRFIYDEEEEEDALTAFYHSY